MVENLTIQKHKISLYILQSMIHNIQEIMGFLTVNKYIYVDRQI